MTKIIRKVTRSLDGFLTRIYIYIYLPLVALIVAPGDSWTPFCSILRATNMKFSCVGMWMWHLREYVYIYIHIYIYIYSRYIIGILIYFNIFYIDNTYTAWGFSLHFLRKRRVCPSFSSSAQGPHLQNAKGVETWRYHGPQAKKQRMGPVVTQKRCFFCDQRTASQLTNAADSTATLEESAWWILEITKILWPRHLLP